MHNYSEHFLQFCILSEHFKHCFDSSSYKYSFGHSFSHFKERGLKYPFEQLRHLSKLHSIQLYPNKKLQFIHNLPNSS